MRGRVCGKCKRRLAYGFYKPTTMRSCVYCTGQVVHDFTTTLFAGATYPVCRVCGVVQRADGQNRPCRGPQKVVPRSEDGR